MMKPPNKPFDVKTMANANCSYRLDIDVPPEIRNLILQHLSETDLANYAMVNRQSCIDCAQPPLPQTRTATISCTQENKTSLWNRTGTNPIVGILVKIQVAASRFNDRFNHIKVINHEGMPKVYRQEVKPITKRLTLPLVTHLDMSYPKEAEHFMVRDDKEIAPSINKVWTQIMPNLEQVNLSYTQVSHLSLADLSSNCPKLSKITCESGILNASVQGYDLDRCKNLKALYLTDTWLAANKKECEEIFIDPDHIACPFSKCIENLERVSLKDAQFFDTKETHVVKPFTQIGLMKFVRAAKKLQWFNSNLTAENIAILKKERPEITFVCK